MIALRIEPLPEGGILVSEVPPANGRGGNGYFFPLLFACSDLGDALDFIKGKLAPVDQAASVTEAGREQVASEPLETAICDDPNCRRCHSPVRDQ